MDFIVKRTYLPRGTRGKMYSKEGAFVCHTIERPRDGEHPCVDEGTYVAERYDSPKHGPGTWQLVDVPGRTNIQIHVANWPHELLGCIAPGDGPAECEGEPGVRASRAAYNRFMEITKDNVSIRVTFKELKYETDSPGRP